MNSITDCPNEIFTNPNLTGIIDRLNPRELRELARTSHALRDLVYGVVKERLQKIVNALFINSTEDHDALTKEITELKTLDTRLVERRIRECFFQLFVTLPPGEFSSLDTSILDRSPTLSLSKLKQLQQALCTWTDLLRRWDSRPYSIFCEFQKIQAAAEENGLGKEFANFAFKRLPGVREGRTPFLERFVDFLVIDRLFISAHLYIDAWDNFSFYPNSALSDAWHRAVSLYEDALNFSTNKSFDEAIKAALEIPVCRHRLETQSSYRMRALSVIALNLAEDCQFDRALECVALIKQNDPEPTEIFKRVLVRMARRGASDRARECAREWTTTFPGHRDMDDLDHLLYLIAVAQEHPEEDIL